MSPVDSLDDRNYYTQIDKNSTKLLVGATTSADKISTRRSVNWNGKSPFLAILLRRIKIKVIMARNKRPSLPDFGPNNFQVIKNKLFFKVKKITFKILVSKNLRIKR